MVAEEAAHRDQKVRKALKGLRWLLYRHSSTRSKDDTRTLKALEKANNRIYRAQTLTATPLQAGIVRRRRRRGTAVA